MKYKVVFSDKAKKFLKKLDESTAKIIISWLRKNVDGKDNPRAHGKALVGNMARQMEI